jgi:hypothetical protein
MSDERSARDEAGRHGLPRSAITGRFVTFDGRLANRTPRHDAANREGG